MYILFKIYILYGDTRVFIAYNGECGIFHDVRESLCRGVNAVGMISQKHQLSHSK